MTYAATGYYPHSQARESVEEPVNKIAYKLASNEMGRCPFCRDVSLDGAQAFVRAARHLQEAHGLECMHVGSETTFAHNGNPWLLTVAVFGSEAPPQELPEDRLELYVHDIATGEMRKATVDSEEGK